MTDFILRENYDAVPYPNLSHMQTHPNRLATVALLLGLDPPPVDHCRVLELGCAGGGNLIPMAEYLPDSTFVGVDNSTRQIEDARRFVDIMQLGNITFEHKDICDITPDFGQFDYIIAHGVYSWVAPNVRDHVMRVCKQNLAPNGIAYVSYNTLPGWHMLLMAREMMLYHTRDIDDPRQITEEAHDLIRFLSSINPAGDDNAYGSFLRDYINMRGDTLRLSDEQSDSSLLHDELADYNEPVYFHQFADHAARHGLQYLAEADLPSVMPNRYPEPVVEYLRGVSRNLIEMEQYIDFIRNKSFRQTLLVHEDIPLERSLSAERVTLFSATTYAQDVTDKSEQKPPPGVKIFRSSDGALMRTDHPVTQAAMQYLIDQAPLVVPFTDLFQAACQRLNLSDPQPDDAALLAGNLLTGYTYSLKLVNLYHQLPPYTVTVSERPRARTWARVQAQVDVRATNLRHERVDLDVITRRVLPYIDGEHDQAQLVEILWELTQQGVIGLKKDGAVIDAPDDLRAALHSEVERTLEWLAYAALLIE